MYYEFVDNVRIETGINSAVMIGRYFAKCRATQPLLISGPVINKIGTVDLVTKDIETGGVKIKAVFIDVPKDSSMEIVNELVNIYYNNGCDSIIALGGGSVIDTAKGLRLLLSTEKQDLKELQGIDNVKRGKHIPFAIIPTTSGTGSEVTKVAVISDTTTHVKHEFISECLLPDMAVLDPRFTATLPVRATVTTAFDMLTHAIEAYTGTQKNIISDAFALRAIDKFRENFFSVINDGSDLNAREGMAEASLLAGMAFSNSMVGLVHAIGHSVGGVMGIAHDVAMMMLLTKVMRFNLSKCESDYATLLYHLAGSDLYADTKLEERGEMAIKFLEDIIDKYSKEYDIKLKLADYGVTDELVERIVDNALRDGAIIANRKYASYDDVRDIVRSII